NPDILNVLKLRGICERFRKVTFAGCQVGNPISRGEAANGTILLFAFAKLWQCQVRGAVTDIAFNSFNRDTGAFEGPMRTWDDAPIDDVQVSIRPALLRPATPNVRFRELIVSDTT